MENRKYRNNNISGFTLIELLITMAIASIVVAASYMMFASQQRTYVVQDQVVAMHQNLRSAMYLTSNQVRMAGCDFQGIGGLGITNVEMRDTNNNIALIGVNANGAVTFTHDDDADGAMNTTSFSIYDFPVASPDGILDLAIEQNGGGRQLLAENIVAMGMAFAFDSDGDGELDTDPVSNEIIWAVDSDRDNALDLNLDTNQDGTIDWNDGPGRVENDIIGGVAITPVTDLSLIRAVRIWILARTERIDDRFVNNNTYVVGHRVITPLPPPPNPNLNTSDDHLHMELMETTVRLRNF